jgi:hypothetical protein
MKKLLAIFLLLITPQVFANWTLSSEEVGVKYYYDSERINKQGRYIDLWYLINLPSKNKYGDRSAVSEMRVDCQSLRTKILSNFSYKKSMGRGTPRVSNKVADKNWSSTPSRSHLMTTIIKVCS